MSTRPTHHSKGPSGETSLSPRSACVSDPTPATATPERLSACSGLRQRCPHLPRTSRVTHARYVGRIFASLDVSDHAELALLLSLHNDTHGTHGTNTSRAAFAACAAACTAPAVPAASAGGRCSTHAGHAATLLVLQEACCSCSRRPSRATNRSASAAGDATTSSRAAAAAATAAPASCARVWGLLLQRPTNGRLPWRIVPRG